MLRSIECGPSSIRLAFTNESSYAYSKQVWDWVNIEHQHSFILVVGRGHCGENDHRVPWAIGAISYDDKARVASLSGEAGEWKSSVHSYELHIGSTEEHSADLAKRLSGDRTITYSLNHSKSFDTAKDFPDLPINFAFDGGTSGKLHIEYHFKQHLFGAKHARVVFKPIGFGAWTKVGLHSKREGKVPVATSFEPDPFLTVPLQPYSIPYLVEIGPYFDLGMGADIGPLDGSINATAGASLTISDQAIADFDLFDPESRHVSGWRPEKHPHPLNVSATVSGNLKVYAMPALNVKLEVLGSGFEAGLAAKLPAINAKFEAQTCKLIERLRSVQYSIA